MPFCLGLGMELHETAVPATKSLLVFTGLIQLTIRPDL